MALSHKWDIQESKLHKVKLKWIKKCGNHAFDHSTNIRQHLTDENYHVQLSSLYLWLSHLRVCKATHVRLQCYSLQLVLAVIIQSCSCTRVQPSFVWTRTQQTRMPLWIMVRLLCLCPFTLILCHKNIKFLSVMPHDTPIQSEAIQTKLCSK